MTKQEIEAMGLCVTQHGRAWRVHGYGVDILVADLRTLRPDALKPVRAEYELVVE